MEVIDTSAVNLTIPVISATTHGSTVPLLPASSTLTPVLNDSVALQNASTLATELIHPYPLLALLSSVYTQVFSGLCATLASLVTFHHIYCHLTNYTCHNEQRYIVRILFIIPAYALYSFISIMLAVHAKMNSVYIEPIHDIAEALAIYSFLALCYQYLGGEGSIMIELFGKTIKSSCFYGTCCFAGKPYTILFLRFCKVATLQYTFIKPFTSLLSIILSLVDKYSIGDFSPKSGYLYLFFINNFTVTLALYGLLLFYFATQEQLRPFNPILKFATIKAIIFFSFWQDVVFTILEWSNVVYTSHVYPAGLIAAVCKNVLICFELVVTAIALRYAFPYSIYVLRHPPRLVLDFSSEEHDWPGFAQTHKTTLQPNASSKGSGKLTSDAPSSFTNQAFDGRHHPQLPWADTTETWTNRKPLPSISASIKATMDPRDIFVDAVHNFHPTYRHYTQTTMDETF